MTTIREQIIELAARPEGVTSLCMQKIMGMRADCICAHMLSLVSQGRVVRAKVEGRRIRWFATIIARDDWVATKQAAMIVDRAVRETEKAALIIKNVKRRADKDLAVALSGLSRQSLGRKAPPSLSGTVYTAGASKFALPRGEPIITSNTKVTIVPTPDVCARWQAQPSQPVPGFSSIGIGRYL